MPQPPGNFVDLRLRGTARFFGGLYENLFFLPGDVFVCINRTVFVKTLEPDKAMHI